MDTISQKNIKEQNLLQICDCIFNTDFLTRYEISQSTGLSIMTVGKAAELLKQAGVIQETKDESAPVGRKAGKIRCCSGQWNVVLLDLYHEEMAFSRMPLCNGQPEPLLCRSCAAEESYEEGFRHALKELQQMLTGLPGKTAGIGVLVPGPYNADRDTVTNRRIPQLTGMPLKKIINDTFGNLPVVIEEDVKFAAHSAIRQVEGYETKTIFYTYIGEGVGGAIVQNGENFRSAHSYSADFGQFRLSGDRTVESLISMNRFRRLFPEFYTGLQSRADSGEEPERFIREVRRIMLQCLTIVMWMIDPDVILIDSEYDRFFPDFFPLLCQDFYDHVTPERGVHIPRLLPAHSDGNALYKGARNSVRELFLRQLA